ncbi:MAG TPA: radical SAM family heme chaperone HemW [Longimicrobiales bacterium]
MPPRFLYLHVPFCLRRCPYCDFAVQPTRRPPIADWLDAVDAELRLAAESNGWTSPLELETIYVGGGTPSLLGPGGMAQLRRRLERHARWLDDVEWTAEVNPESFSAELAREWADAGVNRVSIGVQSFHQPALRWMGRLHGPDGAVAAVRAAREAGIDNVSIDLIFALPARLERDWDDDLRRALALEPAHLSLYGLSAEAGTPLGRWVREGREAMADEETYAAEFLRAAQATAAAGLRQYEVSNFAVPGRESRHNSAYWTGAPYLGIGPGAHSFLPPHRTWNRRDWKGYQQELSAGRSAEAERERVEGDSARLERIWLGLRTAGGLARADLSERQIALARSWRSQGWAAPDQERLRLTPQGWLLLDRLALELDGAAGAGGAA